MTTAFLFDLDGTLIHSDPLHLEVFVDLLAPHGVAVDEKLFQTKIHGRTNREIFSDLLPGQDADAWGDRKEAEFRRRLGAGVPQVPGTSALLDLCDARGWAKAVVTNAPRENSVASLDALGIRDRFDAIILGEECVRAKPDPEPYLEALRQLGAKAEDSLAFEDSLTGVRAAVDAGIPTIGMRSLLSEAELRALGCVETLETFADPALAPFIERLEGKAA